MGQAVEGDFEAQTLVDGALTDLSVIIGIADVKTGAALFQAVQAEGIHAKFCSDADAARKLIAEDRLSLAILEHDPPSIDGLETCRAIRQQDNDPEHSMPVVVVASEQDQARGISAGVTDWLIKPFTSVYARTKVRAWILRTACQAMRTLTPERQELRFAQRPLPIEPPRLRTKRAQGQRRPTPPTGTENQRFSNDAIRTEKADLLWMYCREVAPFETASFRKKIGQLIAHATNTPAEV
jgi:DNA-binding response OmpR family regulator